MSDEDFKAGEWAVYNGYTWLAGRICKATLQKLKFDETTSSYRGDRETFKEKVLVCVQSRDEAISIIERLKSAEGELNRRVQDARIWFQKRKADIAAAARAPRNGEAE